MAHAENTQNGFEYSVQTLPKHGIGGEHLKVFGFHGFVLIPNDSDAQPAAQIPVQCLEQEGYRLEDWALDAAIDEAKAIIDGKPPMKDPKTLHGSFLPEICRSRFKVERRNRKPLRDVLIDPVNHF